MTNGDLWCNLADFHPLFQSQRFPQTKSYLFFFLVLPSTSYKASEWTLFLPWYAFFSVLYPAFEIDVGKVCAKFGSRGTGCFLFRIWDFLSWLPFSFWLLANELKLPLTSSIFKLDDWNPNLVSGSLVSLSFQALLLTSLPRGLYSNSSASISLARIISCSLASMDLRKLPLSCTESYLLLSRPKRSLHAWSGWGSCDC